ncbi:LytR/AlgR family response regulator transcription factor [Alteromonas oceanisediminis]|uniref:LytR/AlgR family response regulator transcription factor n=1 Tax=Alteromonas oceanisediminis TaxID=2836180 RepID=UPI001BD9C42C|nr:LytTR family DNA-binding domain-containing protein [Alteromonas oceanisediminis]MBT0587416.1 LytTR family DNA-binding domain-containing protein [Alteromonas oceanisediminis]
MTKVLTALVVDDEPLAIEGLCLRLDKIAGIKVIGEAADGDDAIRLCQKLQPDVLFIDLKLPGINGIEVVQALQSDSMPLVVFVSAYSDYAVAAFEVSAIDYILKPASLHRLQQAVERLRVRYGSQAQEQEKFRLLKALGDTSGLAISELENWLGSDKPLPTPFRQELVLKNSDHQKVFVNVADIQWIDAAGDYMCIHTREENYIVRITMKKLETELDSKVFQRIHKSTLININEVKGIQPLRNNESLLDLGNNVSLKVSRNYSSAIQTIINARSHSAG